MMPALGDITNLIIALVAVFGAWQAWEAKRASKKNAVAIGDVSTKVDGVLAARDLAKVTEGENKVHAEQAAAKDVASADAVRDASTAAQVKAAENGTASDASPLSKKV